MNNVLRIVLLFVFCPIITHTQTLKKIGGGINTEYDEITPVISPDRKTLYFTRVGYPVFDRTYVGEDRHKSDKSEHYELRDSAISRVFSDIFKETILDPVGSHYNQDIWYAQLDNNMRPYRVMHPIYPVNNIYPNSVLAFDRHRNMPIVINEFTPDGGIFEGVSFVKNGGKDGFPVPLDITDFYSDDNNVNMTMSPKGDVIIWALRRENDSSSRDLYISFLVADSYWTSPENLGPMINSEFRESTPFLSDDNKRLYFSSDRPGGLGKMDIYYADRLDFSWKNWSEIKALPSPVNSEGNDSQPCLTSSEEYLYFSSDRGGDSDIYFFDKTKIIEVSPKILHIVIIDSITKEPLSANIFYDKRIRGTQHPEKFFRTETGRLTITLETIDDLEFVFQKRSYKDKYLNFGYWDLLDTSIDEHTLIIPLVSKSYSPAPLMTAQEQLPMAALEQQPLGSQDEGLKTDSVNVNDEKQIRETSLSASPFMTKKIFNKTDLDIVSKKDEQVIVLDAKEYKVTQEYTLDKIYFERSKPQIHSFSYDELENLYEEILKQQPHIRILITGHTDNVGPYEKLMELSKARAQTIKDYLIKKGIEPHRLHTRGFGPDKPLNDNKTEYQRRRNRRVEITYLE